MGGGSQGDRFLSNEPNIDFIAYCFSEVSSYSKFGSYVGNGSSDGSFVYTGFEPALLILKRTSSSGHWNIWDNKRNPHNGVDDLIYPNLNTAGSSGTV